MTFKFCPGSLHMRTPTIKVKNCPKCGEEVEIFSTDNKVECKKCKLLIYNDIQSCLQWCKYAEKCLGEETYKKLKK